MKNLMLSGTVALFMAGLPLAVMAGCGSCGGKAEAKSGGSCESGVCMPGKQDSGHSHANTEPAEMNTAALLALQRAGVKLQLLEARPGIKDLIPGAMLLPADSSEEKISQSLPDKDGLYVTYCGSAKCGASGRLAARLKALGYRNVIEFRQGWAGWSRHQAGDKLPHAELNSAALKVLSGKQPNLRIFDARTGRYDDGRRVPGAGSLSAASSAEEVAGAVPDKNQLIVTYCANLKCPASRMLADQLRKMGYMNVIEYPMGIEGWAASGFEVSKVK